MNRSPWGKWNELKFCGCKTVSVLYVTVTSLESKKIGNVVALVSCVKNPFKKLNVNLLSFCSRLQCFRVEVCVKQWNKLNLEGVKGGESRAKNNIKKWLLFCEYSYFFWGIHNGSIESYLIERVFLKQRNLSDPI